MALVSSNTGYPFCIPPTTGFWEVCISNVFRHVFLLWQIILNSHHNDFFWIFYLNFTGLVPGQRDCCNQQASSTTTDEKVSMKLAVLCTKPGMFEAMAWLLVIELLDRISFLNKTPEGKTESKSPSPLSIPLGFGQEHHSFLVGQSWKCTKEEISHSPCLRVIL